MKKAKGERRKFPDSAFEELALSNAGGQGA